MNSEKNDKEKAISIVFKEQKIRGLTTNDHYVNKTIDAMLKYIGKDNIILNNTVDKFTHLSEIERRLLYRNVLITMYLNEHRYITTDWDRLYSKSRRDFKLILDDHIKSFTKHLPKAIEEWNNINNMHNPPPQYFDAEKSSRIVTIFNYNKSINDTRNDSYYKELDITLQKHIDGKNPQFIKNIFKIENLSQNEKIKLVEGTYMLYWLNISGYIGVNWNNYFTSAPKKMLRTPELTLDFLNEKYKNTNINFNYFSDKGKESTIELLKENNLLNQTQPVIKK